MQRLSQLLLAAPILLRRVSFSCFGLCMRTIENCGASVAAPAVCLWGSSWRPWLCILLLAVVLVRFAPRFCVCVCVCVCPRWACRCWPFVTMALPALLPMLLCPYFACTMLCLQRVLVSWALFVPSALLAVALDTRLADGCSRPIAASQGAAVEYELAGRSSFIMFWAVLISCWLCRQLVRQW
jgi:hypothetical protein